MPIHPTNKLVGFLGNVEYKIKTKEDAGKIAEQRRIEKIEQKIKNGQERLNKFGQIIC